MFYCKVFFSGYKYKNLIMNDLANKKCVPCEGNIPPFDKSEIHKYLKKSRWLGCQK